jgi:hypothetical protein
MPAQVVEKGHVLGRHPLNTLGVNARKSAGQIRRKVTLKSHRSHTHVTGHRYAQGALKVWPALFPKADGDGLNPDPNGIEHALPDWSQRDPRRDSAGLTLDGKRASSPVAAIGITRRDDQRRNDRRHRARDLSDRFMTHDISVVEPGVDDRPRPISTCARAELVVEPS